MHKPLRTCMRPTISMVHYTLIYYILHYMYVCLCSLVIHLILHITCYTLYYLFTCDCITTVEGYILPLLFIRLFSYMAVIIILRYDIALLNQKGMLYIMIYPPYNDR